MRVFVRHYRSQRPRVNRMPGWEAGVQVRALRSPESPISVSVKRTLAMRGCLNDRGNERSVRYCFETQDAGFAEVFIVHTQTDEVKSTTDRQQRIRRPQTRCPLGHGNLAGGIRQLFGSPPVGGG